MSNNIITVLGAKQTFELPANISVHEHNGGWNINICDTEAKSRTNPLGIVFSLCTKATPKADIPGQLIAELENVGAKPVLANV